MSDTPRVNAIPQGNASLLRVVGRDMERELAAMTEALRDAARQVKWMHAEPNSSRPGCAVCQKIEEWEKLVGAA